MKEMIEIPEPDKLLSTPLQIVTSFEYVLSWYHSRNLISKNEEQTAAHIIYELLL
tara:strand:- start:3307 stop:3471 length:165 start_codon:yes stop_codon:yes gene_type:complete